MAAKRVTVRPAAVDRLERLPHELSQRGFGSLERTPSLIVSALVWGARAWEIDSLIREYIREESRR